ncbi:MULTISPECIES: hypothetical protein [Cupriavidus]|jgi:hypothetical protein|uniref:hypothetical protein n=1 Tax=Cupriavidus TaxID=106589 RepID=UPI000465523B|nr:hypothetical protein [Cupriavidus metallidurans]KWW32366.1 hypothetical protein AU374_05966 [Cupriavidus metallidurans]
MIADHDSVTRPFLGDRFHSWLGRLTVGESGLLRIVLSLIAGAAIGWMTWGRGESVVSLLNLLALPLLWGITRSRWEGLSLMLAYFAAGSRDLPGGAVVFFGDEAPHWWGLGMWLAASVLLSAPFALCWSRASAKRAMGFVVALLVTLVPPLGIVGWLNPLSVAGILFPAGGWVGLALTFALFISLMRQRVLWLAGFAVVVAAANVSMHRAPRIHDDWLGFDTSFPRLSSAGADYASQYLSSMQRIEWLRGVISEMPANATLVLPETLIGRFDGVAQAMLAQAEEELTAKNSKVLVGAELPQDSGRYKNAVVVLGAKGHEDRAAIQGIPVPISMWKPWTNDGAEADLLARSNTITVNGLHVGVTVCYEQLLAYSLVRVMADKPDVIVAVSNVWWARSTNIPQIQAQSVRAFARLFRVPVVSAKNI